MAWSREPEIGELASPKQVNYAISQIDDDPSAFDISAALFRQDNILGSFIAEESGLPKYKTDVTFNAWDYLSEDEKLDGAFVEDALLSDNESELNAVRRQITREREDRNTIANGGALSAAIGIGQSILDPIFLVTAGVPIAGTYRAGKSVLSSGFVTAGIVASETAAYEAALHATQLERTYGESSVNLAASTLLGMAFGSGVQKYINSSAMLEPSASNNALSPDFVKTLNETPIPVNKIKLTDAPEDIKTTFLQTAKEELLGDAGQKLDRKTRKLLNVELNNLKTQLNAVVSEIKPVIPTKGISARKAKQDAVKEAKIEAENIRFDIQEKINNLENQLDLDTLARNAEADVSRAEQGIVPQNYQLQYADLLAQIEDTMNVEPKIAEGINPAINPEDAKYFDELNDLNAKFLDEFNKLEIPTDDATPTGIGAQSIYADIDKIQVSGTLARFLTDVNPFDPLSSLITSDNPYARLFVNELAENPTQMDNYIGQAAESFSLISQEGKIAASLQANATSFKKYKSNGGTLTKSEFNIAVSKAIRQGNSNVPEIQESANAFNRIVYDPLKKEMIEQKLLPEDVEVTTANNYLNRMWNADKIDSNYKEFINVVAAWLRTQDQQLLLNVSKAEDELISATGETKKQLQAQINKGKVVETKDLDLEDYQDIAGQIATRIKGSPDGRLPYDWKIGEGQNQLFGNLSGTTLKGPMKDRVFNIPDNLVEQFLENDIELLASRYINQVVPDIEITRKMGSITLNEQKAQMNGWRERQELRATTAKERGKINKQRRKDEENLIAIRDRMRGTYGLGENNLFNRSQRAARDLNYLRLLGGVTISSFPEMARVFGAEGFYKTFKNGVIPLATNINAFKLSTEEAGRFGIAMDSLLNNRGNIAGDIADYTQRNTAFERGLQSATDNFGKINVLNTWTASMKQLNAVVMQTSVFDDLANGVFDKRLSRLGITEDNAKQMFIQAKKHGGKNNGVWLTGAKNWDDPELERMWGAALRKEVNRVIMVPGQEKPLFLSTEMGKTWGQFRSFTFSSQQRMLIASLQNQDHNTIGGLLGLITLGIFTAHIKDAFVNRETTTDPIGLILEGIDRSGALGLVMEANNTIEKVSSNKFGLRPVTGVTEQSGRFFARSIPESLLGPTYGSLINTSTQVANSLSTGDITESDCRAARRLIPYQNLFYVKHGFDAIQEACGDL